MINSFKFLFYLKMTYRAKINLVFPIMSPHIRYRIYTLRKSHYLTFFVFNWMTGCYFCFSGFMTFVQCLSMCNIRCWWWCKLYFNEIKRKFSWNETLKNILRQLQPYLVSHTENIFVNKPNFWKLNVHIMRTIYHEANVTS